MKSFSTNWHFQNLFRDRRSIAALEFALVAPLLILLGLGSVEFAAAIRVNLGVDRTARSVAQLIAATPLNIAATQATINTLELQDAYQAGLDCFSGLNHTLTISAASLIYKPGSTTPTYAATASKNATSTTPWDASTASGLTPGFVALPTSAQNAATGLGDGIDTDSVIVVQATATYSLPFLPNFAGLFGLGKIPTGPFSTTATAFARPRGSLIIAQGF